MNNTMVTDTEVAVNKKNPYPGLRSFKPDEAKLFFGREKQVEELLRKLRTTRFITVLGHSGSGKSSLVKCGLIPRLQNGFAALAGSHWSMLMCRPGANPIGNLSWHLAQKGFLHDHEKMEPSLPTDIEQTLRSSSMGLVKIIRDSELSTGKNFLIIIDQFEELFRFSKSGKQGDKEYQDAFSFVNLLLSAHRQKNVPIYIALTMRADFLGHSTEFRGLPEVINDGQYIIPRMKRDEIKRAIVGPAQVHGVNIDPKLTAKLLDELGESADQLPILQHALMRMWEEWLKRNDETAPIDLYLYNKVGTLANALSMHAEDTYSELTSADDKLLCEKIFKAITEKGDDNLGVSRPMKFKELSVLLNAFRKAYQPNAGPWPESSIQRVIEVFSQSDRSFLMSSDDDSPGFDEDNYIKISHEALMRVWGRLVKWVSDESTSADVYRRLSQGARLHRMGKSGLWRNPELQIALNWRERNRPNPQWAERYSGDFYLAMEFLDASHAQYMQELQMEEEENQSKIKRARNLARAAIGAGVIFLGLAFLSLLLFLNAVKQRNYANEKEKMAALNAWDARNKKAEADRNKEEFRKEAEKNMRLAEIADSTKQLALKQSEELRSTFNILNIKTKALEDTTKVLEENQKKLNLANIFALDQARIAEENKVKAQNSAAEARRLQSISAAQALAVKLLTIESPAAKAMLALEAYFVNDTSGGKSFDPYIYEALFQASRALRPDYGKILRRHDGSVNVMLRWGKHLVTASNDGTIRDWVFEGNITTAQLSATSAGTARYTNMAVSQDGKWLAAAGSKRYIELFQINKFENTAAEPQSLDGHSLSPVNALAFLASGKGMISAGNDQTVQFYDFKNFRPIAQNLDIKTLVASTQKDLLFGASPNGNIYKWELVGDQFVRTSFQSPNGSGDAITSMAISRDDRYLAVGTQKGMMAVFDIAQGRYILSNSSAHESKISTMQFNREGTMLITGGIDGKALLWITSEYLKSDYQPVALRANPSWVVSASFTDNDKTIVVGCSNGEMTRYDVRPSKMSEDICARLASTGVVKQMGQSEWDDVFKFVKPSKSPALMKCAGADIVKYQPDK